MDLTPLAVAQELVYLGAALAVALLLAWQLRLAQRFRMLDMEVKRLGKAQKDGSLDARSRLEEATRTLEGLEKTVTPKLSSLEPQLIQVGARVDGLEERLARLAPELEAAGRRETETSEVLADARVRLDQVEETAREIGKQFGAVDEGVRDARGRLEQTEHGLVHLRTTLDERIEALDRKLAELETVPPPPPREPTRAALGLASRPGGSTATAPVDASDASSGATDETPAPTSESASVPASESEDAAEPTPVAEEEVAEEEAAEEEAEDMGAGMRGLLLGVIVLAALTMLLHFMGVGR